MKVTLRIFNLIIMALAAVATVFLFITPTMSFNSNIGLNVAALSKFIPETTYTGQIDVPYLLGTDVIQVSLQFQVDATQANRFMNGDRATINEELLKGSINGILKEFHEPVDLITEFTVKDTLKRIFVEQVTQNVDDAIEKFKENNPTVEVSSTTQEMMNEVGMDDAYFTNFTCSLYDAMNIDHAPSESVVQVMYDKIDEALALADESGIVDTSGYSDEAKAGIRDSLLGTLDQLKLRYEDGTVKQISSIAYIYLTDYLKTELQSRVSDPAILEQGADEETGAYGDRMVTIYVETMLPDTFYQIIGYTCLGMFIGMFVFAAIWVILFLITLFRTFSHKPWTIFGPWFWFFGFFQLVLGVGLTIVGKVILPRYNIPLGDLPIKSFVLAPRTCALIPSLIFGACIVLAIIYGFFKRPVKREMRKGKPTKKDLVVHEG